MRRRTTGLVYLICFRNQDWSKGTYKHAGHYLGFCGRDENEILALVARIAEHRAGHGAKLTQVAVAAGLRLKVTRTWRGTRSTERLLKDTWHGSVQLCPDCCPSALRHGLNRKRQRRLASVPF